jgi:hypothetical protein
MGGSRARSSARRRPHGSSTALTSSGSPLPRRNRDHSIAAEEARAKRICATCPVTAECLDYALRHGEKYGVWGGLTPRARRRLTASFPRPAALPRGGPSPDQASPEPVGARVGRAPSEAAAPDWHLEGSA